MSLIEEVRIGLTLPSPSEARAIRERAGVSEARLGQELGVTRGAVAKWERGDRRPRGDARLRYARVLADLKALVEAA